MKKLLVFITITCLSLSICGNLSQNKIAGRIQTAKMDTGIGSINGSNCVVIDVPEDVDIGSLNSNYYNEIRNNSLSGGTVVPN